MNKINLILGLMAATVVISGCNNNTDKSTENNSGISEAQVETSSIETNGSTENTETTGDSATDANIGGKVTITSQIQEQILALTPALYDYKAGDEITNEMRFAFVYYGYASGDLSRYTKKTIDLEGVKNTWALIPEADVKNKFMNTFGVDIGDYRPTLNEDDPTVYYAKGYYYVCTTNPLMEASYSHIANEDSVVKVKCQYVGDNRYNEYKVTLSGANNTNGYVISKVSIVSK